MPHRPVLTSNRAALIHPDDQAGPRVRIRFPPAESLRTIGSAAWESMRARVRAVSAVPRTTMPGDKPPSTEPEIIPPGMIGNGASNSASASTSATSLSRNATSSATASMSRHAWKRSPSPAGSAFPGRCATTSVTSCATRSRTGASRASRTSRGRCRTQKRTALGGAGARLCCLQRAVDGSFEFAVELEGLVVSERQKLG
jgi:hypothetical protein